MILAGADTTGTFLQFFVLCMLQPPEVLRKAQQEIDAVIGAHRTPELEDIDNLPYIQAIIHEVFIPPQIFKKCIMFFSFAEHLSKI